MKTLADARREATASALAKARLRQAQEHRIKRAAERSAGHVAHGSMSRQRERILNQGNYLRRCLNPDCLVWFATRLPKANWCCEECLNISTRTRKVNNGGAIEAFVRHALMVSKRNAEVFDRPKLTPYARALVAKVEAGVSGMNDILHAASVQADQRTTGLATDITNGTRMHGNRVFDHEPSTSFAEAWWFIGFKLSSSLPNRPCDHSSLQNYTTT